MSKKLFSLFKPCMNLIKNSSGSNNSKDWYFEIRKLAFNLSRYNRYGLYSDDLINYANPMVKEALRRLPKNVLDARNFRLIRAMHLEFLKVYLPEEKWITFEQDLEYRYLKPYIAEIIVEREEIRDFGCTNYRDDHWPAWEVK